MEIKIIGNEKKNEYSAAVGLKNIIELETKNSNGKVLIMSGFNCLGQKVRDIDIVVFGQFESNLEKDICTKVKKGQNLLELKNRTININNFCFCIEVKDHSPEFVTFEGNRALVKYNDNLHDASSQSEDQKYSLINYLKDKFTIDKIPRICNFLWFRNINQDELPSGPHNYLGANFDFLDLMTLACTQNIPCEFKGNYYFNSCKKNSQTELNFKLAYEYFEEYKKNVGKLTRKRLEKITKEQILKDQSYVEEIGKKLVVIRGRAGTGKTIKLLRLAYDLCNRGERCLILTYNKALVSDIRRLIALAEVSSDITSPTIDIRTIHSFIRVLLVGFGIYDSSKIRDIKKHKEELLAKQRSGEITDREFETRILKYESEYFVENYEKLKSELIEYINQGVINQKDIQSLMKKNQDEVAWDKILIDEAQDWPQDEKEILFTIFQFNNFIIGDGIDQFVRGTRGVDWTENIKNDVHINSKGQRKSLRQKSNLCKFIQAYSNKVDVPWQIDFNEKLPGGKVIITTKRYDQDKHSELLNECLQDENKQYEMLFLVPPSFVDTKIEEVTMYGKVRRVVNKNFKYADEWKQWGIKLWDGTASNLINEYPTDVAEHRLLQYDSCRGLEGWFVINLAMDKFFNYKIDTFKEDSGQLELISEEEKAYRWAHQWIMIAFTRAIDTIVITIEDPNSDFAKILRSLYNECQDFISWID